MQDCEPIRPEVQGAVPWRLVIECAHARVTTGEWARALRDVFGEYRPATGVDGQKLGLAIDRVEELRNRTLMRRRYLDGRASAFKDAALLAREGLR